MTLAQQFERRGIEKGMLQGMEQGMLQGKLDDATEMLKDGIAVEKVVKFTKLPLEEVLKLLKDLPN